MKQISFIGLGNMGRPMAENCLKAGLKLKVFDINKDAVAALVKLGAQGCSSAAEAVAEAQTVISMLPSSPHVEDLYLGQGKVFESAPRGALLIDCSTIAPDSAKKVATEAQKRGFTMVDAPVSGGTGGAAAGTLTFMMGGDTAAVELAKAALQPMGKNFFHAGPSGSGQVAKICNNMLLAIHMAGTAETLALGQSLGIDIKVLSEIMSKSSGRNWSLEVYNPAPGVMDNVPASKGYEGGFAVDLMAKDLGLALEAATRQSRPTPMGSAATTLYRMQSRRGEGRKDFSSIFKLFEG